MQHATAHVPHPQITVDADGTARSLAFDDVYFSARGGVAETEHVFLAGNGLPERWQGCGRFTIGELGFGTGLNFLVAADAFLRTNPTGTLHFLSVEKYPLTPAQLREAYAVLSQGGLAPPSPAAQATPAASRLAPLDGATQADTNLVTLAEALCAAYPLRLPGWHRVKLGRVQLTLGFGDVAELLPQMDARVDAWFLDGFAPAKNDAMWSAAVLSELARLSAPGARFATFTAAGAVKRGLQEVGFDVQKTRGFAYKRDMLVGRYISEGGLAPPSPAAQATPAASGSRHFGATHRLHQRCEDTVRGQQPEPAMSQRSCAEASHSTCDLPEQAKEILIIGAGIAGATTARALAERGYRVQLFEAATIASGASGNPAAVLYPQLTKYYGPATAWHLQAYSFTLQQLAHWKQAGLAFACEQPGMLKLATDAADAEKLRGLQHSLQLDPAIARWVEADEASAMLGHAVPHGGYYFAQGTWLNPAQLCNALLQHAHITVRENCAVQHIARGDAGWQLTLADGTTHHAAQLVVANANDARRLLDSDALDIRPSAGQVSLLEPTALAPSLPHILCHKGYAIHTPQALLLGATYDRADLSCAVTEANHAHNINELQRALPQAVLRGQATGGRTSLRATTPHRLPYVGQVQPGLYVNVGHGSRGMISAPLAAEILASEMAGEPLPISRALRAALQPPR
ncbi:MAG: hypothetical protein DI582_00415 [Azospirillum brasilense]|nr:MAG: hypothetical protein DI582_00415 [Azospirillum brasilense]